MLDYNTGISLQPLDAEVEVCTFGCRRLWLSKCGLEESEEEDYRERGG